LDDLRQGRHETDEIGAPSSHRLGRGESRQESGGGAGIAIDDRVGDPDLDRRVGVRDRHAGQPVKGGELTGPLVAGAQESRIVHLDPVDEGGQASDLCVAPERPSKSVEGMRHPDEPALLADLPDRILRRQPRRHRVDEEDADEVALGRPDLLADDDGQAGRSRRQALESAIDPIVVGDGEVTQASLGRDPDDIDRPSQRIEARPRMAVEIDERPRQPGCLRPTGRVTS